MYEIPPKKTAYEDGEQISSIFPDAMNNLGK